MKRESPPQADKEKVWEEQLYHAPFVDARGIAIEKWTRDVAVGITLLGLHVDEVCESGNGVEAFPYLVVEPTIDRRQMDHYNNLLKKRKHFEGETMSERDNTFIEEMQSQIASERERVATKAAGLIEEYYTSAGEDMLDGLERIDIARDDEGRVIIVPRGARMEFEGAKDAGEAAYSSDENDAHDRLFAAEFERFAQYLRDRYLAG